LHSVTSTWLAIVFERSASGNLFGAHLPEFAPKEKGDWALYYLVVAEFWCAELTRPLVRNSNRSFTWLTNAFSTKFENHSQIVPVYAVWYNFLGIHKTLRVTPAMASGLSQLVMDWSDIVEATDAHQPTKKRGSYKK